jgi:hypothetical protein
VSVCSLADVPKYVNFTADSLPVAKAEELADGASSDLDIISSVYNYIIISLHILPMIIPKLPV